MLGELVNVSLTHLTDRDNFFIVQINHIEKISVYVRE